MTDSRILLVVGGMALCLLAATWLVERVAPPREGSSIGGTEAPADAESSANLLTVRSVVARLQQWPQTIEAFGNVAPWEEMIVSAQVEGQPLLELRANVGDRVQRGQVLARFDTDKLRAEVWRLSAETEQTRAELDQRNAERDRALQLADSGALSKQEILNRVTAAQVAAARLGAARAQLSARELDLRRANVIAPDEGTVSARSALPGMIGTSGLELFRIIRRDKLEWRGELTAAQHSLAAPGQPVLLSLPDGAVARARIRHVAPAMNLQTRLATVYADIEPGGSARAGSYVSGRIILEERPALVVPASGIVVRDGHSFAFKVTAEGDDRRVEQQRVEVGRRVGAEVEILAGLSKGERVVAQGAGFLDDGDRVRVVGASQ